MQRNAPSSPGRVSRSQSQIPLPVRHTIDTPRRPLMPSPFPRSVYKLSSPRCRRFRGNPQGPDDYPGTRRKPRAVTGSIVRLPVRRARRGNAAVVRWDGPWVEKVGRRESTLEALLRLPASLQVPSYLRHEGIDQLAVRALRIGGVEREVLASKDVDLPEGAGGRGGATPD